MPTLRKTYGFVANPKEQRIIELVKQNLKRKTYSDLIRYLLMREAEKILPNRTTKDVVKSVYSVK